MYTRAQAQMSRLRDMATRGMKSAAAAASAAATEMKSMASGASGSPSPSRRGGYSAFDEPSDPRDVSSPATAARYARQPNQGSVSDDHTPATRLAQRLDAGAAAAEILFDMRAHSTGRSGGGATAEEAETLRELRVTCEDHLNTLARVVESGGVNDDALLQRAIEVAESLVAAIGDDEIVAAAAAEREPKGYAPPTADLDVSQSGVADASGVGGGQQDVADLLGGLDVGGARRDVAHPTERPSTEAEEEAMVAAAIAASLAEAQPSTEQAPQQQAPQQQAQQQPQQQQAQPPPNLIDF